jgi:hypothetical protein
VASVDPSTDIYEIPGLPGGFVQVAASADGFAPLTSRVAVGLNLPTEFVLQRLAPVPQGTNRLIGMTRESADEYGRFSGWGGVKVEILDGPLAGVFTFSDYDMAEYVIDGLPAGLIHVRASAPWLESQTLAVVVKGDTWQDFVMKRQ